MAWQGITIERLEMVNFKRFYGPHIIQLSSQPELGKPLVLIGGENGRGKTSIHEAINYALYEDEDLPGVTTRPNYLKAVSDRLNRRALDEGATSFSVALEITGVTGGSPRSMRIEREWEVSVQKREAFRSKLTISEAGRPVDFLQDSPAAYQEFLRSLLPPRVAPFFFFDGERIQEFADDDNSGRRLVEAIEDILHISVYKTLRNDLKTFVVEHLEKTEVKANEADDYFELQKDKERIDSELEAAKHQLADLEWDRNELLGRQRQVEDELNRVASPHSADRDTLIEKRSHLALEAENVKRTLQECFESLPLVLSGRIRQEVLGQIARERDTSNQGLSQSETEAKLVELGSRLFCVPAMDLSALMRLSDLQAQYYSDRYHSLAAQVFAFNTPVVSAALHDVGEPARNRIIRRLEGVSSTAAGLRDALNRRERLAAELRDVENKIQSTSSDPRVGELITENRNLSARVGAIEVEARTCGASIQRLTSDLAARQRQIEDRLEKRRVTTRAKMDVKLAQTARRVLDDFIIRLAPEKLRILKSRMEEMYHCLLRPEDPVASIDIDPQTWQVILYDEKHRPLEKRVFSAGMREIYALSLLWALAKSSGRDFPIVIDTPVGRLDSANRRSLFEKYLPNAGHQVIVLSTDTEVDVEWAKKLAPFTARQYRLDHDPRTNSTVVRPGYFS